MCDGSAYPTKLLRSTFIEAESVTLFEVHVRELSSSPTHRAHGNAHEHVTATLSSTESGNGGAALHIRRLDYNYMYTVVAVAVAVMAQVREINSPSRRTGGCVVNIAKPSSRSVNGALHYLRSLYSR